MAKAQQPTSVQRRHGQPTRHRRGAKRSTPNPIPTSPSGRPTTSAGSSKMPATPQARPSGGASPAKEITGAHDLSELPEPFTALRRQAQLGPAGDGHGPLRSEVPALFHGQ